MGVGGGVGVQKVVCGYHTSKVGRAKSLMAEAVEALV